MVTDVLIPIGHHRAASVPPLLTDDVDLRDEERICRPHDGAEVEVLLPVLDGEVDWVAPLIKVGADRVHRPVAVHVTHIASVAVPQQFGVKARIVGPRLRMRTNANGRLVRFDGLGHLCSLRGPRVAPDRLRTHGLRRALRIDDYGLQSGSHATQRAGVRRIEEPASSGHTDRTREFRGRRVRSVLSTACTVGRARRTSCRTPVEWHTGHGVARRSTSCSASSPIGPHSGRIHVRPHIWFKPRETVRGLAGGHRYGG